MKWGTQNSDYSLSPQIMDGLIVTEISMVII